MFFMKLPSLAILLATVLVCEDTTASRVQLPAAAQSLPSIRSFSGKHNITYGSPEKVNARSIECAISFFEDNRQLWSHKTPFIPEGGAILDDGKVLIYSNNIKQATRNVTGLRVFSHTGEVLLEYTIPRLGDQGLDSQGTPKIIDTIAIDAQSLFIVRIGSSANEQYWLAIRGLNCRSLEIVDPPRPRINVSNSNEVMLPIGCTALQDAGLIAVYCANRPNDNEENANDSVVCIIDSTFNIVWSKTIVRGVALPDTTQTSIERRWTLFNRGDGIRSKGDGTFGVFSCGDFKWFTYKYSFDPKLGFIVVQMDR